MRQALILTGVLLCISLHGVSEDSAMFRGNPEHTGVYQAQGVPKFRKVKWEFHTGGVVIASPAVVNGTVFIGSTDGNFYALDSGSGVQKWKFEVKSRITSSAAVSTGTVYFGAYNGTFYAIDAMSGKSKWTFQTGGEHRFTARHLHGVQPAAETMPDPFDVFLSSPVVWNGAVYFGSGDGNVYSLDATSGSVKWKFQTGDVVHASPAISDGTVFVGSWDSYFYALDAVSGKEKWRFKTGDDPDTHNQVGIQSSAAVANGMVIVGCRDSHLYALDVKTGEKKWALPTDGAWVVASPAVQDGKVYVTTSDSSLLFELNANTGAVEHKATFNHWFLFSSPALTDGVVYFGSTQGKLIAVSRADFQVLWSFETQGLKDRGREYTKSDGSPNAEAIYGSDFYDDMVAGLGRIMGMGAIVGSPVIVGDTIYVSSGDGNVYALI